MLGFWIMMEEIMEDQSVGVVVDEKHFVRVFIKALLKVVAEYRTCQLACPESHHRPLAHQLGS